MRKAKAIESRRFSKVIQDLGLDEHDHHENLFDIGLRTLGILAVSIFNYFPHCFAGLGNWQHSGFHGIRTKKAPSFHDLEDELPSTTVEPHVNSLPPPTTPCQSLAPYFSGFIGALTTTRVY